MGSEQSPQHRLDSVAQGQGSIGFTPSQGPAGETSDAKRARIRAEAMKYLGRESQASSASAPTSSSSDVQAQPSAAPKIIMGDTTSSSIGPQEQTIELDPSVDRTQGATSHSTRPFRERRLSPAGRMEGQQRRR